MELEIVKAMVAAAKADEALSARVSNRVYFGKADDETLPYVVLYPVVPDGPQLTFSSSADFGEETIQISMWDAGSSWTGVELIASDLSLLFHRQTLTLDSKTFISLEKMPGGMGPIWDTDAWQRTMDFMVRYQ